MSRYFTFVVSFLILLAATGFASAQVVISLTVDINKNDTGTLRELALTKGTTLLPPTGSDYKMRVLSAQGLPLFQSDFNVVFVIHGEEWTEKGIQSTIVSQVDTVAVSFRLPFTSGADKVDVMHGGKVIFQKKLDLCNRNNVCEPDLSENFVSCPADCPSGSADNYCDAVQDNKCDLDCAPEADLDCLCGNNKCDVKFGENFKTCSKDCPSGGADKFCDGKADNICDPDCTPETDPDCKPSVGGPGLVPAQNAQPTRQMPTPSPSPRQPGFEFVPALAALGLLALVFRRRR